MHDVFNITVERAFSFISLKDLGWKHVNDKMERIHVKDVSCEEFIRRYEAPFKPVVIQGVQDDWNASYKWTLQVSRADPTYNKQEAMENFVFPYEIKTNFKKMNDEHFFMFPKIMQKCSKLCSFSLIIDLKKSGKHPFL